jgi:hypothetical protein
MRSALAQQRHLHEIQNKHDLAHFLEVIFVHNVLKKLEAIANTPLILAQLRSIFNTHSL